MEALVAAEAAPMPSPIRVRPMSRSPSPVLNGDMGKPPARPWPWALWTTQLAWGIMAVVIYLALALNGGAVALLLRLNRLGGARDIYAHARGHGRTYGLHAFEEMFWPLHVAKQGPRRSLAVFTAGRDGLPNVDRLVRAWGHDRFDYLICHFDESQAEWAKLDWYKQAVGFYAHRQGKMWFFKRALNPYLVHEYEYVHFIDSDAGSPVPEGNEQASAGPFDLWTYERVLREHGVLMGQPAVTNKTKTSAHPLCRQDPGSLLRWTTFVENGPLFSVHAPSGAFDGVWEMVDPLSVSGYGVDLAWCAYLYEQKGFDRSRTCAIVDAHPIDHLDTHSATAQTFGGGGEGKGRELDYYTWGRIEWRRYARLVGRGLLDWKRLEVLRRVPLEQAERVG